MSVDLNIPYRLLYIGSNKNDSNYQIFLNSVNTEAMKDLLEKKRVKVAVNITDAPNFVMILHDYGGMPMHSFSKFDEATFKEILNKLQEPQTNQVIAQTGGVLDYKQKYFLRKMEYKQMKKVVTRFSP